MRIKFLRAWRNEQEGAIRDWPDGAANLLISRKVAVEHKEVKRTRKRRKVKNGDQQSRK